MKYLTKHKMTVSIALVAIPLALFVFQNMTMVPTTTITYSQLSSLNGSLCTIRPSAAGAPYYTAIVNQRTLSGLTDVEVLHHVSSRLGFGLSPFGSLVPNKANDCTTVFIAEELARQLALVGTNVDSVQVRDIRRGLLPFTMYPRSEIDRLIVRFQNDPQTFNYQTQLPGSAHSAVWYKARQDIALLSTLRNVLGSQVVTSTGVLEDHQFNLEERFAEFWNNHFNVDNSKADQLCFGSDSMPETMRKQTGSTFYSLLYSVIQHPTMLRYLDNHANFYQCVSGVCSSSNQNLARELMELHTFGVGPKLTPTSTNSPYSQADVVALSEILSGWNVKSHTDVTSPGQFYFNSTLFAPKTISLLGVSYPGADAATAQARVSSVLKMLANHSQTKTNICTKLAKNLFASSFMSTAASACVSAWGTDGNLKAIYKAMLLQPNFWSKANYKSLYRTPIEVPVAAARALGMNIVDMVREIQRHGFTETPYNPSSLTIANFAILLPQLKGSSVWWAFYGIGQEIRSLLGVYRGEIALPIGYSDNGLDHLSSSYVDESSRIAFNLSNYLEGMDKTGLRIDKVSSVVRSDLENRLTTTGNLSTQQHYIQNILNMGSIVRYTSFSASKSGYELPASQQAIVSQVVSTRTAWPYFASSPGSYCIDKAVASLVQGSATQLKK